MACVRILFLLGGFAQRGLFFVATGKALTHVSARNTLPAVKPEADLAYVQGLLAYQQGHLPEATQWWTSALSGNQRYVELLHLRVETNLPLAQLAAETYPESSAAWEWLGDATAPVSSVSALVYYQQSARLQPRNNLVWEKIGHVAEAQGNFDTAITAYRNACDINPIRNGACHSAARLAYRTGDWQTVIYYYVRGSYPEHVEGWVELIRAAQHLGLTADAERYLHQAQAENPADYHQLLQSAP